MSKLSRLIDNVVVDGEGNTVGCVDEIIVRCRSGQISNIVVKRTDGRRINIPWSDFSITSRGFVLNSEASLEDPR